MLLDQTDPRFQVEQVEPASPDKFLKYWWQPYRYDLNHTIILYFFRLKYKIDLCTNAI